MSERHSGTRGAITSYYRGLDGRLRAGDYKTSSDWIKFRRQWLKAYPPLDNGHYLCGICGAEWVRPDEVTLDHIEPRTADNIFDDDNIQPASGRCNYLKGSRRLKPAVSKESYDFMRNI